MANNNPDIPATPKFNLPDFDAVPQALVQDNKSAFMARQAIGLSFDEVRAAIDELPTTDINEVNN